MARKPESLPEVMWNYKKEWSFAVRRGSRSSDGKECQRAGGALLKLRKKV